MGFLFSNELKGGCAARGCACALLLLVALSACAQKKDTAKAKPAAPVIVATAVRKDVPVQIRAIGNVEAYNTVFIKAQVNGQIAVVHFREGDDVKKGALLFTIDPRPYEAALRQAQAALAKDQAQAKYSHDQMQRYSNLLKEGIVSQDQYEQLKANADAYDAAIAADRAAVENAKIQLGYCSIRSPINGRTGNLAVQAGNLVKANDVPVLVTINQVSPIYATFSVPEKDMLEIRKYMSGGNLKVEALIPNDTKGGEYGTISFLDNAVDIATGTIKLKGRFANASSRLWPGQFVSVVISLTSIRNAVVVPSRAIQTGQQGQYVFVVKADQTVEQRPVVTGVAIDGETAITGGIKASETVVTDGQVRLIPGAKVEVKQEPVSAPLSAERVALPSGSAGPGVAANRADAAQAKKQ